MAMLITKFHRLIQNKLLWIGFLVVVVFSFVIWGTQMPTQDEMASNDAGVLNGEPVPYPEYRQARFNTYLALVLMTGRAINVTPELEEELHTMAWQRLASLREARKMGISTSDDEVTGSIHNFEFLKQNGQFSKQAYGQFAQQFLAPMRATKRDFEEHVRQEIILQKLRVVVDRLFTVSPKEIARTYQTLSDTFDIEYVRLTPELVADKVEVTEEEARAFFDEDPEQFELAEMVKIKAAVIPVEDFVGDTEITDEEIQEYYDFNIDQFAVQPDEEETTNLFSTSFTTYQPIEDVKDDISTRLSTMQAAILAESRGNEFVQELSNRRAEGRDAFDAVVADFGIEMIMVKPFTARQAPTELEAGPAVVRAAFNLTDDADYYYSDPVIGSNFVYVLSLVERIPERIPEYAEVEDDVRLLAKDMAVYNSLTETGQEIIEKSKDAFNDGKSFNDVLAGYGLSATNLEPFSLSTSEPQEGFPEELIRDVLVCNEGELTDLIPTEDGSILLAHVKARTAATDTTQENMRLQIISTLRRQSSQVAFGNFQDYLLESGGHVDNLRRQADDEELETDEEATAEADLEA